MRKTQDPGLSDAFFKPDYDNTPASRVAIGDAANLLDIGEFDLLQKAWIDYAGKPLTQKQKDTLFRDVILDNKTPDWAFQYAQSVIQKYPEEAPRTGYFQRIPAYLVLGAFTITFFALFSNVKPLEGQEESQDQPTGNYNFLK